MSGAIPIEEVVRAETKHQTMFKDATMTWDEAKALNDRLDAALAEVGGWAKFIGKQGHDGTVAARCVFELYPKRSANKAWRIALGTGQGSPVEEGDG